MANTRNGQGLSSALSRPSRRTTCVNVARTRSGSIRAKTRPIVSSLGLTGPVMRSSRPGAFKWAATARRLAQRRANMAIAPAQTAEAGIRGRESVSSRIFSGRPKTLSAYRNRRDSISGLLWGVGMGL
jgi:hypothetical protein